MPPRDKPGKSETQPTYMKGRKPAQINLHDLIEVLSMIHDHGELKRLADVARQADMKVAVPPRTANAFKDFIAEHGGMSAHPMGLKVLNPVEDCPDKYKCCCFQQH